MKCLLVHNFYQHPGGEDQVFADETALLELHGHQVIQFTVHNDDVERIPRLSLSARTVWNSRVHRDIVEVLRRERPDIVHFHNTFPLVSPAAYYSAKREGIPVVKTLHNYRLL